MSEKPPTCYSCAHYQPVSMIVGIRACADPTEIDIVSGDQRHVSCEVMRSREGRCGHFGQLWKARKEDD